MGIVHSPGASAAPPQYDHVVIVIEENHALTQIIGNWTDAPYINQLAEGGVPLNDMSGIVHPSQPNYLELFSGSNQGVVSDSSTLFSFTTPNLGAALIASGRTFAAFSEGLPAIGDTATVSSGWYVRYHCPWVSWISTTAPLPANKLPASVHRRFSDFPANFATLPTVSIVVPDFLHDMHDGTVAQGDAWLRTNLSAYAEWAKTHNSLLIVTWDEDDFETANRIPTIFYGAKIRVGFNGGAWTLHNLLRTVEDMYALPHSGRAALVQPITGVFAGENAVGTMSFRQGLNGYVSVTDTQIRSSAPTTSYGAIPGLSTVTSVGVDVARVLIRFDDLFGSGPNRIAANAQIVSAKLQTTTTSSSASEVAIHRMLIPWSDASTWNSLVNGISTNGIEASVAPDFTAVPSDVATTAFFDVTETVRQWAAGAPNYGWVIQTNSSDNWGCSSSESSTQRPTLEISFVTSEFSIDPATLTIPETAGTASFTVHRTGAAPTDASVFYTTQGITATAASGDYTGTSGTLTWSAGDLSDRFLTVPITADAVVESDEDFFFFVYSPTGGTNVAANYYSRIILGEAPFNKWLVSKFGVNANAPMALAGADPDGDGASNLLEYATGSEPANSASLFAPQIIPGGFLTLSFRRVPADTDLVYTVQTSQDLIHWTDGSTYSASSSLPATAFTTELSRTGVSPETIVVRGNAPISAGGPGYLRLQVVKP